MWQDVKWIRLTPDRPGRGGQKSGFHTFQQQPINDVYQLLNFHIYRGYWRRDFDTAPEPNAPGTVMGSTHCLAIHGYVYPSLTDPAAQPGIAILGQMTMFNTNIQVYDFTNSTTRAIRAQSLNSIQPGVFQNIGGRCFYGDGSGEGMIFDNRTPAIHAQPNQNIGIGTPTQPLPLTAGISYSPLGTAYTTNNSVYLNHPNPNNMLSTILLTDTVTAAHINAGLVGFGLVGSPAGGAVAVAGVSSNTTPFTATGTISITTGTSLVTLSGAVWPAAGKYCGLSINFNGYSFVIAETNNSSGSWTIDGNAIALSNVQLLILGVYTGPTLTNVSYTITGCQVKLTNPSSALTVNIGTLGYSQMTNSNLVQCAVFAVRANGLYRNLGNISLGPSGNPITHVVFDGAMFAAVPNLYCATSAPFTQDDVGATIIVDKAGPTGTMLVTTIASVSDKRNAMLSTVASATVTNRAVMWSDSLTGVGDAAMAGGSFDLTSVTNPWNAGDIGKTIIVAGAKNVGGDALVSTIATFVTAGHVTLADANGSGGPIAGAQAYWSDPLLGSTAGPTYAYAWYDPETGHMSNISPLFQIPKPTTIGSFSDFSNLSIFFQIDPGFISYPDGFNPTVPTSDSIRFSHIMFFRTLSTPGSSTLYPIGSLMPFVGKVHPGGASTRGSWNPGPLQGWMGLPNNWARPGVVAAQNWYDFSSDSDLLLSGGFRAPQYTNEKPEALLRGGITQPGYPYQLAYWDRRLWLVNTQEPDKICFSCDEAQCPLGVPEESFPPTNFLRLPSVDGRVLGMRTVGDMLLVTTERWAYIIAGNNESNYRLMKASSSMPGVGTYQMDEFPTYTGAEGEPATLFYLGRDRMLYQWTLGAQTTPISLPIQKNFDASLSQGTSSLFTYQECRVHCVSAWGRRLVAVAMPGPTNAIWFLYDIDNQVWTVNEIPDGAGAFDVSNIVPMTTIYGLGIPVNELYATSVANAGNSVQIRSWVRDDQANSIQTSSNFSTFPTTFDGKKIRKEVVAVNLHATSGTWQLIASSNEAGAGSGGGYYVTNFTTYTDPIDSIYWPTNPVPVDGANTSDLVVMAAGFDSTAGTPLVGYRFEFLVQRFDSVPANIYALDIGYKDIEDPGEGDV